MAGVALASPKMPARNGNQDTCERGASQRNDIPTLTSDEFVVASRAAVPLARVAVEQLAAFLGLRAHLAGVLLVGISGWQRRKSRVRNRLSGRIDNYCTSIAVRYSTKFDRCGEHQTVGIRN